jgi:hypothetical protein
MVDRRRLYVGLGLVVGAVIALGVCAFANRSRSSPPAPLPTVARPATGEQQPLEPGVHIPLGRQGHWRTDPPTSGEHYSALGVAPAAWGFQESTLRPEIWLHNLEHGGVVILYSCSSGCPSDVGPIRRFMDSVPPDLEFGERKLLSTPYPVPGHPFALVAWGWRLFLDAWDPALALGFYQAHVDHAPERLP